MSGVLDKIRSRGYWDVVIHPVTFNERRIPNILDLFPLVQRLSVTLRGWDFPHIDIQNRPVIGEDHVMQELDWREYIEVWQLYQSGQFFYSGAMRYDWAEDVTGWVPKPPLYSEAKILGIGDTVARFTEIFRFASAFALSDAGDEEIFVSVGLGGLHGRYLWMDHYPGLPSRREHRCTLKEYAQADAFTRANLAAEGDSIALDWATEVIRRFGTDPPRQALEKLRGEFSL